MPDTTLDIIHLQCSSLLSVQRHVNASLRHQWPKKIKIGVMGFCRYNLAECAAGTYEMENTIIQAAFCTLQPQTKMNGQLDLNDYQPMFKEISSLLCV
jgi:hypothetical protein